MCVDGIESHIGDEGALHLSNMLKENSTLISLGVESEFFFLFSLQYYLSISFCLFLAGFVFIVLFSLIA